MKTLATFYDDVPNWFRKLLFVLAFSVAVYVGKDTLFPPAIKAQLSSRIDTVSVRTDNLERRFVEIDRMLEGMMRFNCLSDREKAKLAGMRCE